MSASRQSPPAEGGFLREAAELDSTSDGRQAKRARLSHDGDAVDADGSGAATGRATTPEAQTVSRTHSSGEGLTRLLVPSRERTGSSPSSGGSSPMPDSPRPTAKSEREHRTRTEPHDAPLAEDPPPTVASTSTAAVRSQSPSTSPKPSTSPSSEDQAQRRVKVYKLQGEAWDDLGTGWCTVWSDPPPRAASIPVPDDGDTGPWIVVRPETATESPSRGGKAAMSETAEIWRSSVRAVLMLAAGETDRGSYQRQQDTLIVWTEPDGTDMALSFASQHGCNEVWDIVDRVRTQLVDAGHLSATYDQEQSSPEFGLASSPPPGDASVSAALASFARGALPEPALGSLEDIESLLRIASRTAIGREKLATTIVTSNFLRKLISVLEEAEDLESLKDLHKLCTISQLILLLNDNNIFEYVMAEPIFFGMLGMLEYDPDYPKMKASYRAQLSDPNRFREVVPIRDTAIKAKIHQTYRLQYLKDVVLARIIDDQTFSMLNSFIFYHQVDIVTHLQHNAEFLTELFALHGVTQRGAALGGKFTFDVATLEAPADAQMAADRRDRQREALLFWQAFCAMAKNLQVQARGAFYRQMTERGLLRVLEVALENAEAEHDPPARTAAVEILMTLIDHDPAGVRSYCLAHNAGKERTLLSFLIDLFHHELDLGIKAQMSEAVRILVQTQPEPHEMALVRNRLGGEDPEAERFLQAFYDDHVATLFKPLVDLPEPRDQPGGQLALSKPDAALMSHLVDLLCYFVQAHTFRSKYYVLSSTISIAVSRLMRTRLKHLRLAALRFFRACLAKTDEFFNRYLVKHDLFLPVLELAQEEAGRDNLLSSACLDFFEFLRVANVKAILNHLCDKYRDRLTKLGETETTFAQLVVRWEQNNAPAPTAPASASTTVSSPGPIKDGGASWKGGGKAPDADEESYWASSDDDDAPIGPEPAGAASAGSDAPITPIASRPPPKREATDDDGDLLAARSAVNGDGAPPRKRARTSEEMSSASGGGGMVRSPALIFAELREKGRAAAAGLAASPRLAGLVDYGDDEPSPPPPEPLESRAAPPTLLPGELKRRREDDELDEMDALAAAAKPVGPAPSSTKSPSMGKKLVISFTGGRKSA